MTRLALRLGRYTVTNEPEGAAPAAESSSRRRVANRLLAPLHLSVRDRSPPARPGASGSAATAAPRSPSPPRPVASSPFSELLREWATAPPGSLDEATWERHPFDEAAFRDVYDSARAAFERGQPAMPYLLRNATRGLAGGDSNRRLGMEVEFDFEPGVGRHEGSVLGNLIALALSDAGLARSRRCEIHGEAGSLGYTEDRDGGVLEWEPSAPPGRAVLAEWVSPVLSSDPAREAEFWAAQRQAFDIINQPRAAETLGATRRPATNERTAMHVHIGIPDYGTGLLPYTNLLALMHRHQDVLYRLSNNTHPSLRSSPLWLHAIESRPGEAHVRPLAHRRPNTPVDAAVVDLQDFLRERRSRNRAVNLNHVDPSDPDSTRVEFRLGDTVLEAERAQTLVMVFVHLVDRAQAEAREGRAIDASGHEAIGTHHQRFGPGGHPGDGEAFMQETASFREFLGLFGRNIDKARVTAQFATTAWLPPPQTDYLT